MVKKYYKIKTNRFGENKKGKILNNQCVHRIACKIASTNELICAREHITLRTCDAKRKRIVN